MRIINLTQHVATPDQIQAGVFEPSDKAKVQSLLTFEELPTDLDIANRARQLAIVARASGAEAAMIGGASYLIWCLEEELISKRVRPLHAFSKRVVTETTAPSGVVIKNNVFQHVGFVGLDTDIGEEDEQGTGYEG